MSPAFLDSAAAEVLTTINEAWIAMTSDGLIAAWNPAAERMFGWSCPEVVGRPVADVIVPERLRAAHRAVLAHHLATGDDAVIGQLAEARALHRDGEEFPVELAVAAPVHGGEVIYHAFVRDISERRRMERHLEARRAVTASLIGLGPRDPLLQPVTEQLARAIGCELAAVWTRNAGGAPTPLSVVGPEAEAVAVADFGDHPAGKAWSTGKPLFQSAPRCGLWLPIAVGDEVVAVIELVALHSRRLGAASADVLEPLAIQVGHLLERRRVERRILALNERNEGILAASSEGIMGVDCDGRVIFANRAATRALKLTSEDLVGRQVHDAVHGDAMHPRSGCRLEQVIRAGLSAQFDGDCFSGGAAVPIVVDAACSPTTLGEDVGAGAVLTFRDVTERRRLEKARARDLEFLQSVLDSMADGVRACDADGRLTFFNRAMEALTGKPALPIGPDRWAEEYGYRDPATGELLSEDRHPLLRALRGEVVRGAEMLVSHPSRPPRLVTVNGRQLRSADGAVTGAVDVVHDITERRAAEQRMVEAERLASLGTWELDLRGSGVFWSPGLFRLLGLEPGSVRPTAELWLAAVHPDDRERLTEGQARAEAGGGDQWGVEYRVTRADGELRNLRSSIELVRGPDGEALRALGIVQDYTDRARAEAAVARNEARALQADRMQSLGQLAGGVAHDFNNLLAVILASSEFVLEDITDDSATRADVEEIRKAAQRAADLTRRLLVFSRREVVRPEAVVMCDLVRGLEGLLRRTLAENLELVFDLADDLPPVSADHGQLEQMIINLALNARDAMPEGGVLRIEVAGVDVPPEGVGGGLEPGPYIRMRVSDTGRGMSPEIAAHVFEPFFTTKPKGRGTGLGLATVYGAVHEAAGSVSVESELGVGSTFTVILPAAPAAESVSNAEISVPGPAAADGLARQVLVVEDDASVRRVVRRLLTEAGYGVLEAEDGAAAIAVLEGCGGQVDLLLTDVVMTGPSGWDLHVRATERWPWIPTLLMSGYADDQVGREHIAGTGVEFIAKPFAASELLAAVGAQARPASPPQPD